MLSKKLTRILLYVVAALFTVVTIFVYSHRSSGPEHPPHLYYGGRADAANEYIVDLAFHKCYKFQKKCTYSDVDSKGSLNIKWLRVDKNLFLTNQHQWDFNFYREYLFVKTINYPEITNDAYLRDHFHKQPRFVEQVAVYNSGDLRNGNQIPLRVIKQFNDNEESFSEMIMENFEYTKSFFFGNTHPNKEDLSKLKIPTVNDVNKMGWFQRGHGVWVRFAPYDKGKTIQYVDLLFGKDSVDPRPNWYQIKNPLSVSGSRYTCYLTISNKLLEDRLKTIKKPVLKIKPSGKFKILQVADLHFSNGVGECRDPFPAESGVNCKADLRTLEFIRKTLQLENPDFVVLTGDQVFGETSPDALSAMLKSLAIFVEQKIPFAITFGNHDDESSMTREQLMQLAEALPYSLSRAGPDNVDGVGNYYLLVEGPKSTNPALSLWFLDTHKYSPLPKTNPGYDWLKDKQLDWMEDSYASLRPEIAKYSHIHMGMAFFHIPIPEYRNLRDNNIVGSLKEGVTASNYNTGARKVFAKLGVSVVSVGHDHCNDYCLYDTVEESGRESSAWLCYGGAAGEGGYGGYGGTARRMRVFEIDTNANQIRSWKRVEGNEEEPLHAQVLVDGGVAKL